MLQSPHVVRNKSVATRQCPHSWVARLALRTRGKKVHSAASPGGTHPMIKLWRLL